MGGKKNKKSFKSKSKPFDFNAPPSSNNNSSSTSNTSTNVSKFDANISGNNGSNSTIERGDITANNVQDTSTDLSNSYNIKCDESGDSSIKVSEQSANATRDTQFGKKSRNQNSSDYTKRNSGRNQTQYYTQERGNRDDRGKNAGYENKNKYYDNSAKPSHDLSEVKYQSDTNNSAKSQKSEDNFNDSVKQCPVNENWDDELAQTNSVTEERNIDNIKEISTDSWGDSEYTGSHSNNSSNWDTSNVESQFVDSWNSENNAENNNPAVSKLTQNQLQDYSVSNTTDNYYHNNFDRSDMPKTNKFKPKKDQNWRNKSSESFTSTSHHSSNTSKRYSEGSNKDNWGGDKSYAKRWDSKDSYKLYDRYSDSTDKEYKAFCDEERKHEKVDFVRVKEIQQDLFTMSKEYSLGHCVAEDMRMGSGIAVNFKREFKDVHILLNQRQKQGGLAVLSEEHENGTRYIYYLVTKRESTGKPTYEKFWSSIQKMCDHIKEHNVKKLAIPRLGCGLDRLEWIRVKHMLEFLFRDVDVEIVVCNFQQAEDSPEKPLNLNYTCKVVNVQKSVADIEEYTTIIYLTSQDGHKSPEMEELDKKFHFLRDFTSARKLLGDVIKYQPLRKNYILYGCIARKTNKDPFNFASFGKCVLEINKNNRKDKYEYIGIQAIKDDTDDMLMEKILTILKNYLKNVDIYVCWSGDLALSMPLPREP